MESKISFAVNEQLNSANKHIFHTQLLISGKTICEATGSSKKESQQNAASKAFQLINSNPRFIEDVLASDEITPLSEN